MSTKEAVIEIPKVIRLYFAREEILKSVSYCIRSIVFSLGIYYVVRWMEINEEGFILSFVSVHKEEFVHLLVLFVVYCSTDVMWRVLKYRDVLFLRYYHLGSGRCQCGEKHRSKLVMQAKYHLEYTGPENGRLEISCPYCEKIMRCCNVHEEGLFELPAE